ncbi:outer membrane protein assembly factor BamB [Panacagrimonas sp.]|uniref:outer membrane protein assembly factor BamB n=1 Tax=Panacagrimonas sp. TaxID=2480088 RepID=UPI003B528ADD
MNPVTNPNLIRGAVCLSVVLALVACSGKKSSVREPMPLQDISNSELKPKAVWRARAGSGSDGHVSGLRLQLEPDALYTADVDGRVFAYARDSGKLLWRADTDSRVISGPTVSGDTVLLGTLDAEVIALQRSDGSEQWRQTVSSEVMGPPVAEGDTVVVRSVDGRVFGLTSAQGQPVWNFDRGVPSLVLRGNSAPLVGGGRAIIGMDNGRVASLNLADGLPQWEQVVAAPSGRTELERITDVDGDLIDTQTCVVAASFGGELACLNFESGQVQWRRAIRSYANMAVSADKLFASDEAGVVWALDLATGAAAWKQEGLQYRSLSGPAYYNGHVVVGDFEGYLHWLDPGTGTVVARTRAGSDPILMAPVADEERLYVTNAFGRITAFETRSDGS